MSFHSSAPVPADPKVTIIRAPNRNTEPVGRTVFLAGSIDQGNTVDWQEQTISYLEDHTDFDITIYTPRRADWDPKWKPDFHWESYALTRADIIMMYLVPQSKDQINLVELQKYTKKQGRTIVGCSTDWYKRGEVQSACQKIGVEFVGNLEELLEATKSHLLKLVGPSNVQ